jgi:hypothetical protein
MSVYRQPPQMWQATKWPGLQLHQVINNPPELPGSMIDEFVVLA